MQAGGRRFDPVWLHQPSLLRSFGSSSWSRTKAAAAKLEERSRARPAPPHSVREATTVSHALLLDEVACVISDIVKRRSIRVLDRGKHRKDAARAFSDAISRSFVASRRKMARDKTILLVTLDRIAIGPILRSNLVFLINVSCVAFLHPKTKRRRPHSAECVDIDNESNQVP